MPEIHFSNQSFPFDSLKVHGPATLAELGLQQVEIGKNSETLLNQAVQVVHFINKVASDRENRVATTQFFWIRNKSGQETIFIKTPIGDSKKKTKSAMIMLRADTRVREYIEKQFSDPETTRASIQKLIGAILSANGSQVDESAIFVSTIAYLENPANNLILNATSQQTKPFDIRIALNHAHKIQIKHLPHDNTVYRVDEGAVVSHELPLSFKHQTSEPSRYYMDKKQVTEVITEDEETLQQIDAVITERHAGGKFRGQVVLHGVTLTDPKYNLDGSQDYEMFPGGGMPYRYIEKVDPSKRVSAFFEVNYQTAGYKRRGMKQMFRKTPEGLDFYDSLNFAYIKDPQGKDVTHVFIQSPNDDRDRAGRKTFFVLLSCAMPTQTFELLQKLIRKNPENAERFLQIAFAGIDKSTWRIATDRVSLVDIDNYIPLSIINGPKITGNMDFTLGMYAEKNLLNLSAVETHKYSRNLPELK